MRTLRGLSNRFNAELAESAEEADDAGLLAFGETDDGRRRAEVAAKNERWRKKGAGGEVGFFALFRFFRPLPKFWPVGQNWAGEYGDRSPHSLRALRGLRV